VPRGVAALGYAQYLPKEQYLYRTEQLLDSMSMTLGGRAAEQIFFGKVSTGAQNDLERITKLAYGMITNYGMSEKVGQVSYNDPTGEYGYQRPYSEKTAELIDSEVREMIDQAYKRTIQLLTEKKEQVEAIAQELLSKEIIFKTDIERLIGSRPFEEDEVSQQVTELNKHRSSHVEALPEPETNQTAEVVEEKPTIEAPSENISTEDHSEETPKD
jgi:cell division protease FtsH